jgi:hypothetical protein
MSEKNKGPSPGWAWIFAVACGIIPVLTLGGAIPAAIGFCGASGCVTVARNDAKSVGVRVGICCGITAVCWILFVVFVGAVLTLLG